MDRGQKLDAWTVVNQYGGDELATIFWKYGEERHSSRLAEKIVYARRNRAIEKTGDLADLVQSVVGARFLTKSLARVFQAIRIEVNRELENLERGIRDGLGLLRVGGRVVVLSYHSLEDRIVKTIFKEEAAEVVPSGTKLLPAKPKAARMKILTRKPVVPSKEEIRVNPRARSAKLRAAEKIAYS